MVSTKVANRKRSTGTRFEGALKWSAFAPPPLATRAQAGASARHLAIARVQSSAGGGGWLGRRDSNPNNLLQRQVSYR